jgi:hypothetical protein
MSSEHRQAMSMEECDNKGDEAANARHEPSESLRITSFAEGPAPDQSSK